MEEKKIKYYLGCYLQQVVFHIKKLICSFEQTQMSIKYHLLNKLEVEEKDMIRLDLTANTVLLYYGLCCQYQYKISHYELVSTDYIGSYIL